MRHTALHGSLRTASRNYLPAQLLLPAAGPQWSSSRLCTSSPLARHTSQARHIAVKVVETSRGTQPSHREPRPYSLPPSPATQRHSIGYLALFGVAVLWGSYTPAIRLLYGIDTPPDPALLNALQACLSAAFLIAANFTAQLTGGPSNPHPERSNPLMAEDSAVREATIRRDRLGKRSRSDTGTAAMIVLQDPPRRPPANAVENVLATALNWRSATLSVAGAEIGLWMCLAFGLEVAGLQLTSATKVAFLNQVSVLITPLLVHLSGERVRGVEWVACGLGLLGSILVALDSLMSGAGGGHGHGGGAAAGPGNEVLGLIFVLVSAVFFALSTVRLGRYSSRFDPLHLSTASTTTLGVLSLTWVFMSVLGRTEGPLYEFTVIENMLADKSCILTLLWVGLGPGALAAYLQAIGQSQVPPAQAQVIYSTTPLWAAGFAYVALDAGDEAMGGIAWVGAAVMLGSSLMTALLPPNPSQALTSIDSFEDFTDAEESDGQEASRLRTPSAYQSIEKEVQDRQGLRDVF